MPVCVPDGRLEEAVSAAERQLEKAEELGAPANGQTQFSVGSFRPLLYLSRGDEALAAMGETARLAGAEDTYFIEPTTVMLRAHVASRDEAEDGLRHLMTKHQVAFENQNLAANVLVTLLETAVLIEDRELCSVLAQQLAPAAFLSNACQGRRENVPAGRSKTVPLNATL